MNSYISNSRRYAAYLVAASIGLAAAFAGLTEAVVRSLRGNVIDSQDAMLKKLRNETRIDAAFGDSQMVYAIDDDVFSVFAQQDDDNETIAWKIETYFADKTPGRILVQIGAHMLSPSRTAAGAVARKRIEQVQPEFWLLDPAIRGEFVEYWYVFFRRPDYANAQARESRGAIPLFRRDLDYTSDAGMLKAAKFLADRYAPLPPERAASSEGLAAYLKAVRNLHRRGAKICMVQLPYAPQYRAETNSREDFRLADRLIADIAARENWHVVDLRSLSDDLRDYTDPTHLNRLGQLKFFPKMLAECFAGGR